MSDLLKFDLLSASIALKNKEFSSLELTNTYFEAIEQTSTLGVYLEVVKDHAINMAKASDKKINNGTARPLEGLQVGVKDVFCTKDIKTTASSKIDRKSVV